MQLPDGAPTASAAPAHPLEVAPLATITGRDTPANQPEPLRPFTVQIKSGAEVRLTFTAMCRDSIAAAEQHQCLCTDGEYVLVTARTEPSPEEIDAAYQQRKQADPYRWHRAQRAADREQSGRW